MLNKSTIMFIVVLLILATLFGYNYFARPFDKKMAANQPAEEVENKQMTTLTNTLNSSSSAQVNSDFNQLSTQAKVVQLLAVPLVVDANLIISANDNLNFIQQYQPGLVTLFGDNISSNSAKLTISKIKAAYQINQYLPIIAVDHEGGVVQRLNGNGFTNLPSWQEMCDKNPEESAKIFSQSAQELAAVGINVVYAPVLDVAAKNQILKTRVCADYDKSLNTADQYIQAFAKYKIMSVVKHFPGIGNISQDLHNKDEAIEIDLDDALMFQRVLDKYPNIGVMTAHLKLKDKLDGLPCSLSSVCLQEFNSTYQEAIIFTDALDMKSALLKADGSEKTLSEVSIEALLAGNNVLVYGRGVHQQELTTIVNDLVTAYDSNEQLKSKVDQSVQKLLKMRAKKLE